MTFHCMRTIHDVSSGTGTREKITDLLSQADTRTGVERNKNKRITNKVFLRAVVEEAIRVKFECYWLSHESHRSFKRRMWLNTLPSGPHRSVRRCITSALYKILNDMSDEIALLGRDKRRTSFLQQGTSAFPSDLWRAKLFHGRSHFQQDIMRQMKKCIIITKVYRTSKGLHGKVD
jgi:hypothetical protein